MRETLQRLEHTHVRTVNDLGSSMEAEQQQQLVTDAEAARIEAESVFAAMQLELSILESAEPPRVERDFTVIGISGSREGNTPRKSRGNQQKSEGEPAVRAGGSEVSSGISGRFTRHRDDIVQRDLAYPVHGLNAVDQSQGETTAGPA